MKIYTQRVDNNIVAGQIIKSKIVLSHKMGRRDNYLVYRQMDYGGKRKLGERGLWAKTNMVWVDQTWFLCERLHKSRIILTGKLLR